MGKLICFGVAGLLVLALVLPAAAGEACLQRTPADAHSWIVTRLMLMVAADADMSRRLDLALESPEPGSYWQGKTRWDLYDFLDQWLVFLPRPGNARTYMDCFYELTQTVPGRKLVLLPEFRDWLRDFMEARGEFMDGPDSAAALPDWLRDPAIDMGDYLVPSGGFQGFNQFFTRELRPGVRPISAPGDASILTSPADSTLILISQNLTEQTRLDIKGDQLNLSELLGGSFLAQRFLGGQAVLCMLGTTDYHHFHAPVEGRIADSGQLGGLYYGMDTGWVDSFFQHRRGYYIFETARFGYLGMVCVGMFTISSIVFSRQEGEVVQKGDKLGNFAYGGSAIILLFEPDKARITLPLAHHPVKVQMGQQIGVSLF